MDEAAAATVALTAPCTVREEARWIASRVEVSLPDPGQYEIDFGYAPSFCACDCLPLLQVFFERLCGSRGPALMRRHRRGFEVASMRRLLRPHLHRFCI